LARNRYGWQKRAKEIARKEKTDEKMKRRQGKTIIPPAEESLEVVAEGTEQLDDTAPPEEDPADAYRQG
jgi:hypothetical protein